MPPPVSRKLFNSVECKFSSPLTSHFFNLNYDSTSIERDHKQIQVCKKGQPSVAVKIEGNNQPMYGRHLEEDDTLYSAVSRKSIDTLKEFFRSDVSTDEWKLIVELKKLFDIV